MPPLCRVLVLYLMGFFSGQIQVFSWMQKLPFDMVSTSFDDQYDGCEARMEEKVGELQRAEFAKDADYRRVWEMAAAEWNRRKASISVPKGLKPDYAIALLAYTQKKESLYRKVNNAVREAGKSEEYYLKNFHFKSFHFLLTKALQVLRTKCYGTYRGVRDIQFMAERSKKARFGSFASSSLKKETAEGFGDDTFFTINTCHGANITKYSFYPEEKEVLIPPYELFQVADSIETSGKIRIRLTSAGVSSNYNCVYIKGAGVSHLHVNVRMPFLFWGFLLVAGTLGGPGIL